MVWLKKVTFIILSAVLVLLSSCENVKTKVDIDTDEIKEITLEDLVEDFFIQIQQWNIENSAKIDSLGHEISQFDSTLTFYPLDNHLEVNSFVFSAKQKEFFKVFEKSEFLSENLPIQNSDYRVWRKKLNNRQVLDLSIEPHPVLGWLFVVRKRGQE